MQIILTSFLKKNAHTLVFLLVSCHIAFTAQISAPVNDPFHEGELIGFVWHMRNYYHDLVKFPLFVHGAMDYIPSTIASLIFGDASVIIGTRLLIATSVAIVYFCFADICYSLAIKFNRIIIIVLISILILCYSPPFNTHILDGRRLIPLRELFLFITIWCFVKESTIQSKLVSRLYLFLGSSSAVIAFHWCYDRGVMAVIFVLIVIIGFIVNKNVKEIIVVSCSSVFCIAILNYFKIFGTTIENAKNIRYWLENASDVNIRLPFNDNHMFAYLLLILLALLTILVIIIVFYILYSRIELLQYNDKNTYIVIGLLAVQLLLIKSIFGRTDVVRCIYSGWPSIFILIYLLSRLHYIKNIALNNCCSKFLYADVNHSILNMVTIFGIYLITLMVYIYPSIACNKQISIKNIRTLKSDKELIPADIDAISKYLVDENIECYFNWTNEGVIPFFAGKSYCTDYLYVHYASGNYELDVLEQLKQAAPKAIVYDTKYWSIVIDDRHMSKRFPRINQYIQENYRKSVKIGSYIIVLKTL